MALPAQTVVQNDFSAGQITERAARRDDLKIQRSGLKQSINTRMVASGAIAQRFGRSAYQLGTGRTERVRLSDTQSYEFLFGEGTLTITDQDGTVVNEFTDQLWTLATIDQIIMAQAERDVVITYRNNRPKKLRLGASAALDTSGGTGFGDMDDGIIFPQVEASVINASAGGVTYNAPLPSGIEPGELLLLVVSVGTAAFSPLVQVPTGWTALYNLNPTYSYLDSAAAFWRVADGSEGATVTLSSPASGSRDWQVAAYRISAHDSQIEATAAATGSGNPDPASLSPSWGSANNLWLTAAHVNADVYSSITVPSSYGNLLKAKVTATLGVARRENAASSEDPGAWSSASGAHVDSTIAVKPLSAASELIKAFDANTNKPSAQCVVKSSATSAYIGIELASASAVAGVTVRGSNDKGFVNGATPDVTITLYGKAGSAPSSATDGDNLGDTGAVADTANESAGRSITSSDSSTEYDYLWVVISHDGSAADIYAAQVSFEVPSTTLEADSWQISPFFFAETPEGAKRQPYIKFSAGDVTLLPSARTGTGITVTFSDPVLSSQHVGVSFRYHGREIVMTAVASAVSGTANVIETLPPTMRVTCASANQRNSFRIGQVVIGETSGAEGLIVAFNSTAALDVVVYKGDSFTASERIVSASGLGIVTGSPSEQTAAASTIWDEAAMSDYRGWPRSVSYDRSRLILCDFPQAQTAIAESAIGALTDFYIGADPTDGFFEFAPGQGRVLHVVGGADQYVLTDLGVMYIPISESNPLAPGSVSFRPIAALGASSTRPVAMHEGIVYAAANGKSLIAIVPTGQTSFPYRTATISEFHADLFTGVKALAAMTGGGSEAEQYLWVCQTSGVALVGKFDSSNEWVGFVPVTGEGSIQWLSAIGGDVRFNVQYQSDDSIPWAIELLDEDQYLDGAVPLNLDTPALRPDPEDLSKGRLWMYAGLTVDLMNGETWLGARVVDEDGDIVELTGDDFSGDAVMAGFGFDVTITPYLPNAPEGADRGQRVRRRHVKRAVAHVQDATQFTLLGRTHGGTASADGTYSSRSGGRSYAPDASLVKTMPGPFTLTELVVEVAG